MSDTYTHGHHDSVLRSHRWRTVGNSAFYLVDHLSPGMSLLDVGCGPGTLTADLATRLFPGRVVGIDRSEGVLEEARRLTRTTGNVDFRVGDVYDLDYPDGSFDVVHAHQVLQHLTDPVAALREMRRVCRSGGLVAARDADYRAMTWWPGDTVLDRWMEMYQVVARSNGAEPDAGRRLVAWAQEAGFTSVTGSASVWCFSSPADREWWGDLWAQRVTESDLAVQALARGAAREEDLAEMAEGWRRWAAADDGWFAVLHGEILCSP